MIEARRIKRAVVQPAGDAVPEVAAGLTGDSADRVDEPRVDPELARAALDALAELGPAQRTDHGMVEEALRRAVRSVWKKGLEKRPMVLPVVLEM